MRREFSGGGVVFRRDGDAALFLLIKDRFGRWTFPKGHIDPGETAEQAARREVAEETGLVTVRSHGKIRTIQYWFHWRGDRVLKRVAYYLFEASRPQEICLQTAEGISDHMWARGEEALPHMGYKNNLPPLEDAIRMVAALPNPHYSSRE
jgi:deoxyribose-phosphate aldolase